MDTTQTAPPPAGRPPYFSGGGEVNPKTGLPADAANLFAPLMYTSEGSDPVMAEVLLKLMRKPLRTFEEYINAHADGDSQYAARIFSQSDPAKVAALDALIAMFNTDRERIVRERDFASAGSTWKRAAELIYGGTLPLPH